MHAMAMRIHRLLAEASVQTLESILHGGMVADRAVAKVLGSHPKWGARDRAFVASTVYEAVRWRRRLEFYAGCEDAGTLAAWHWALQGYPRPEWAAWPDISPEMLEERQAQLALAPLAVRESVSEELDALGATELREAWPVELHSMNAAAPVFLRVNPLRSNLAGVTTELAEAGILVSPVDGAPLALRVEGGKALPARMRQTGRFEIQDAASQQVAPFTGVQPGERVVDACAGNGGKTLHLAALMQGRGELLALDVQDGRLAVLRERAARAGVKVRTSVISPAVLVPLEASADCVLVDAPCSGSGTLRRQADLKYRITAASVAEKQALQRQLLAKFAALVRPGGRLVYATCSIFPAENEQQAAWFSGQCPDFTFEEERRISPAATGWDGFYIARWRRT